MAKALDAPYEAGRRGGAWLKVKRAHTLDLVVLAVEPGSGRRRGWLSNLHLGARDPARGGFVMLGQDLQGHDRRHAGLADGEAPRAGDRAATATWSMSARSWWSRSPSTTSRRARATRAAWRSASPASSGTGEDKRRRGRRHHRHGARALRGPGRRLSDLSGVSTRARSRHVPGGGMPISCLEAPLPGGSLGRSSGRTAGRPGPEEFNRRFDHRPVRVPWRRFVPVGGVPDRVLAPGGGEAPQAATRKGAEPANRGGGRGWEWNRFHDRGTGGRARRPRGGGRPGPTARSSPGRAEMDGPHVVSL